MTGTDHLGGVDPDRWSAFLSRAGFLGILRRLRRAFTGAAQSGRFGRRLSMAVTIIGIDCAVSPRRIGLALGMFEKGQVRVEEVVPGETRDSVIRTVANWIARAPHPLIALDAPLGWPTALARVLPAHQAGAPINAEANKMFRRLTDRVTRRETGKLPLDVGADRIARTARAALELLQDLRQRTGLEIPLAWKPGPPDIASAIEVYPAATLKVYGITNSKYKRKREVEVRREMLESLRELIDLPDDENERRMLTSSDALDAVVCVLAGADFLHGEVIEPTDMKVAKREGWIWVRSPGRLFEL